MFSVDLAVEEIEKNIPFEGSDAEKAKARARMKVIITAIYNQIQSTQVLSMGNTSTGAGLATAPLPPQTPIGTLK